MGELKSIWKELKQRFDDLIEPFESWENADAYRSYWRPEKVRVVLLAESHVFTTENEASQKVRLPDFASEDIPAEFVKLVYCLGYGETELLEQPIVNNLGTWQFWKIFYSCLHQIESTENFTPILVSGTPSFEARIKNKLEILSELKKQGIWLLDASLAALYPKPPDNEMYLGCLEKSWPYVRNEILEAAPEKIIVIGKGVWNQFLKDKVPALGIPSYVQPRPQAHLTAEKHLAVLQRYYELIHDNDSLSGELKECSYPSDPPILTPQRPSFQWTYNEEQGYYTRGKLSLGKASIILTLYSRKDAASPETKIIDSVLLNLHELLVDRYIRYENSEESSVRIRIIHGVNGRFYIQQKKGTPRYLLG